MKIIKIKNLCKSYNDRQIISNFNLDVIQGEFICIKGPSGCGKSTLLNIIGGLVNPDNGEVFINNNKVFSISTNIGRKSLSEVQYMFQKLLILENKSVEYNLNISRPKNFKNYKKEELNEVLKKVNLELNLKQKCYELSGGEQQRLVMGRLLLTNPKVILCDEPAGSLDKNNANIIYKILKDLSNEGITILCVSHDDHIKDYASRTLDVSL